MDHPGFSGSWIKMIDLRSSWFSRKRSVQTVYLLSVIIITASTEPFIFSRGCGRFNFNHNTAEVVGSRMNSTWYLSEIEFAEEPPTNWNLFKPAVFMFSQLRHTSRVLHDKRILLQLVILIYLITLTISRLRFFFNFFEIFSSWR